MSRREDLIQTCDKGHQEMKDGGLVDKEQEFGVDTEM